MLPFSSQSPLNLFKKSFIRPILQQNSCKICLLTEQESNELLISPCNCIGSMEFIHQSCQKKWIQTNMLKNQQISKKAICMSLSFNCQLCKSQINLRQNYLQYFKFYIYQIMVSSMITKLRFLLFISIIGVIAMNYFVFLHFKNIMIKFIRRIAKNVSLMYIILSFAFFFLIKMHVKISVKDQNFIFQILT